MPEENRPAAEWINSPDGVLNVYANSAHVTWSLDDVRIRLGQLVTSPETPSPGPNFKSVVEERAAVTFSWRNAKLIANQLALLIANYEKVNGEIVLNPKLAARTDESPTPIVQ
jgi:hypothetical protein